MINASFLPNAVLVEMISNLELIRLFLEEKMLLFYTDENQEEVDFDSMILLSSMRTVYSDAYLGYFLKK
jgi:hypothetical protein